MMMVVIEVVVVVVVVMMMINTLPVSCEQLRSIFESIYTAAKDVFTHSYESENM
jgi:hypothetical protein